MRAERVETEGGEGFTVNQAAARQGPGDVKSRKNAPNTPRRS